VLAGTDARGETCLVGYVVPEETAPAPTGPELAGRLSRSLPAYLIPAGWVFLDRIPLTASGKLDRAALPASDAPDDGADRAAPRTALEKTLHDLWCAELGTGPISIDTSFFQLGGHSLTAVGLVGRIRDELGVELGIRDFLHTPTIRGVAGQLSAGTAPASGTQERLWDLHHAAPRPAVFNVGHRIDVEGSLDVDALRRALTRLAERHPALRTRFEGGAELRQVVLPTPDVQLSVVDADDDAWCQAEVDRPFDVAGRPPWRVRVGRRSDTRWTITVVLHHLICDGWSMGVLWHDLSALYAGSVELDPATSYQDYVTWRLAECAANRSRLVDFWRARLSGVPLRLPLPVDRPRPERLSGQGALHRVALSATTVQLVQQATRALDATPAALLTAAFGRWLGRLCDREALVLAVSSASRVRPQHASVVGAVGEALLVRLDLPQATAFGDLVDQAGERIFEALDHHLLPLREVGRAVGEEIVTPQILFTVVTTPPPTVDFPDTATTVRGMTVSGVARTELYMVLVPAEDTITLVMEYSTDLFDERTVAAWAEDFQATLAEACRSTISPR
jgi:acyl carrier protein